MWSHLKDKSIILPKITSKGIEKKVNLVLREMEKTGIQVDVPKMNKLAVKIAKQVKSLEKQIRKLAKQNFNVDSPIQLSEILFEKMKLPTHDLKKTKSGISTAATELKKIESKHKIIAPILEYRELKKLLTTYLLPLPLLVDEKSRLHTSYGQDTATGRITSSEPNLQNIPIRGSLGPEIRAAFVAGKGNKLVAADYSQIELRVVACLAEDEAMVQAFHGKEDIHTRTASEIFSVPIDKVTKEQRRRAKTINFGILYGMSPYGLSQALSISQDDAAKYIKRYFEVHKGIKEYCTRMIDLARSEGYVETLFGFRRDLPSINSPHRGTAEAEERVAINTPVQGTAAEIQKLAMIELNKKLKGDGKMLLTIHDELVVEAPADKAKKVAELVKQTMENVVKLCVPIEVEVGVGDNWAECK